MGSVNSHFMNTEHSDQLLRQESTIIGDNTKIDDLNTKLNESMIYTGFWHRLFKKSKTLDNEPPHLNSNILNDQQNKSNIQSNDDSLQNNVAYQHTTNKLLTTDKTVISKPISIDSNELRNNTKLFEHKYSSEYGQHHQFQITSLSNRKQRLLRNHHQHPPRAPHPPPPPPPHPLHNPIQLNDKLMMTSNLISSKYESKSQNYLDLNQSPKMRFIRKLNTFASVPDLTKKPIRSALKGSRNSSVHRSINEHEQVVRSSNPLNSNSFSLTPPSTPNDEMKHLVYLHSSDLSNTIMNIKPISKTDHNEWLLSKLEYSNSNSKISPGLKIEYSQYSPEFKRSNGLNKNYLDYSIKHKDNHEDLKDHEGFMVTSNEVNLSPDHQMNDDIMIVNNDIKDIQEDDDNDDDEDNEQIVEDSKSSTPRFHSKLLRRDSMECYLETNKAHDIRHERDHPLSDLIEGMKNGKHYYGDSTNATTDFVEEEEEEENTTDSDDDCEIDENSIDSLSNSIRDEYSLKPLITEVLSPSLCASGYGPVGHLLTRWLPQRNFCELLIGSNESPNTSEEAKWLRRKDVHRSINEHEQVVRSSNPLNSNSFSLTPPSTPNDEMKHLVYLHSSDLSNTMMNIKLINKTDHNEWLLSKLEYSNSNSKISPGLKIEYSQYSPEFKRSNGLNKNYLDYSIKHKDNHEDLKDHEDFMVTLNEVNISADHQMNDDIMIVNNDIKDIQEDDDNDDDEDNEQIFEDSKSSTPRFHSKLLRRDSMECYLETNKTHDIRHERDHPLSDLIEGMKNGKHYYGDSTNATTDFVEEEEEEENTTDSDDDCEIDENSIDSLSNSIRDEYSLKPLITEVLSPSLCASGYGPVGHLLTRWLPQRNFCELLIGSNESPNTSEEAKWLRRKELLKELARTSTIYTEGMTQEMFMLRFSEFVEVQELEPCDRSADKPWIRLTSKDKAQIRRELNDYKMDEMDVHQDSRQFTRFHLP
ncbi:unnamed protein product [Schistosoma rodhaini]|nr:unnamed protein product [Schistosoma rodhaini]